MMRSATSKSAITPWQILIARLGAEKKRSWQSKTPAVRVVKLKSKNPLPRVLRPGGETKMLTRSNTHQTKVIARKTSARNRSALTDQRLYGETWTDQFCQAILLYYSQLDHLDQDSHLVVDDHVLLVKDDLSQLALDALLLLMLVALLIVHRPVLADRFSSMLPTVRPCSL